MGMSRATRPAFRKRAMFAGERRWNREPLELRRPRRVNVAETHGWHQQLGVDIRIDAWAERCFRSAPPSDERAGAMGTDASDRAPPTAVSIAEFDQLTEGVNPPPISLLVTGDWNRRPWWWWWWWWSVLCRRV